MKILRNAGAIMMMASAVVIFIDGEAAGILFAVGLVAFVAGRMAD